MTETEDQRREWNKTSESDIPRAEAKQPYRKRENDSASGPIDLSTCRKVDTKVNQEANPKPTAK